MKIHTEIQGTPEWLALRASYFTASEAPAMMGVSKYQTRSDLLKQKATGLVPEVDAATQRLFDQGHQTEEKARAIVETMIGEDLYPVVGSAGNLLASMDGMTMLEDVLFEHKLWNQSLVATMQAGEIDPHYYWQLEQQLLVSGAEKVLFVCSDGTEQNFAMIEYRPVPGRAEQLLAGWKQFEQDLAEYQHAPAAAPAPVGTAPEALPALRIEVTGMVTASNLDAFKQHAFGVIGAIRTDLQNDQDFADADKTVKWLKEDVEDRLEAAKRHALSQTASIDELFRTIDLIAEQARAKRLELNKLVEARKKSIREDIVLDAAKALQTHIDQLNATLGGKVRLPRIAADFAGVIKGKKTIASLTDAASTELARAKIEASQIADGIRVNLTSLHELAGAHAFLFSDAPDLVLKANDDLVALIKVRIAEHEQREADRLAAATAAANAAAQARAAEPAPVEKVAEPIRQLAADLAATHRVTEHLQDDGQRIKLGDIAARLGFSLSADFLRSLGIEPVERDRSAMLYRASDFDRLCAALIAHIQAARHDQAA